MKRDILIFLLILIISAKINIYTQNKKEIQDNIKKVINQEKYNYHIEPEKQLKKKEPKFKKFLNNIISFFVKIFKYIKKIFLFIWGISPIFSIIILIGLSFLFVLFILWISKQIDLSIKRDNKVKIDTSTEDGHFNYIKEFNLAKQMLTDKKYKEAISLLINSLWLFYYHNKKIKYEKSKTNREYLKLLINIENYDFLRKIIFKAEKAVYYKENISESESKDIFGNISEIIFQ